MALSKIQQETQIQKSLAVDILDNVAPSLAAFETNTVSILDDLNNIRSQLHNLLKNQGGNWHDDLNVPATLDAGAQRGINDLNTDLHGIERKRFIVARKLLVDVTVGATANLHVLLAGQLPTNTTAAVGAVTTQGVVAAAHGGVFGTAHSLTEVAGAHALAPKSLLEITDNAGDPLLSGGRRIWGLFQTESATDGHTIGLLTPNRAQISFVRPNAGFTDLEACPAVDIQGKVVRYCYAEREGFDDLTEQDFAAGGASIDIGAGAATVTRQVGYDNQGVTPVDVTTSSTLDLEGPGLEWIIRDDLQANLLRIVEGSAGGTSTLQIAAAVDSWDNDAAANDMLNGVVVDSGSIGIDIAAAVAGVIQRAADLRLSATGAGALILEDSNMIAEATWTGPGVKVSATTGEVVAYETKFGGEVSLMNAIVAAANAASEPVRTVSRANLTANVNADVDIGGVAGGANLDAQLVNMSTGVFIDDYAIYLNGQFMRVGANAAANLDVYPGTSLANGQLKFEEKLKNGDTITVVKWVP